MATITRRLRTAAVGVLLACAAAEADGLELELKSKHDVSTGFSPKFREASGLGLAKNGRRLWSVGDEDDFSMYKMKRNGAAVSDDEIKPASGVTPIQDASFEGVTYAPPPPGIDDDHFIYLVDESTSSIVPINYETGRYNAPVPLSGMAGLSTLVCQGGGETLSVLLGQGGSNSGLEGITWDGDRASFFILKEKDPGLLIQVSADLTAVTACQVLTFAPDYSGLSYDASRKQFWIVSDEGESVAVYDWASAKPIEEFDLGFDNGEGVAYDQEKSRLYIVTDNGGGEDSYLYVYKVR